MIDILKIINLILLAGRLTMVIVDLIPIKENQLNRIENLLWAILHFLVIQFS